MQPAQIDSGLATNDDLKAVRRRNQHQRPPVVPGNVDLQPCISTASVAAATDHGAKLADLDWVGIVLHRDQADTVPDVNRRGTLWLTALIRQHPLVSSHHVDLVGSRRAYGSDVDQHLVSELGPQVGVQFVQGGGSALAGLGLVFGLDDDVAGQRGGAVASQATIALWTPVPRQKKEGCRLSTPLAVEQIANRSISLRREGRGSIQGRGRSTALVAHDAWHHPCRYYRSLRVIYRP